jgi:hypothetical protein
MQTRIRVPAAVSDLPRDPRELRKLAAWYRAFAERTDNPVIWEGRLATAAALEQEAVLAERHLAGSRRRASPRSTPEADSALPGGLPVADAGQ